jgi:hypothetical protein
MDYLSASTKAQIEQIHLNGFDTYKRSVKFKFYLEPKEVVVDDPNFLYDFDSVDSNKNELIEQVYEFDCCLIYLLRQEFGDFIKGDDTNVKYKAQYNRIKVQVKEEAFETLKNAERYVFGDETYAIEQSWRKLGAFQNFNIYEIVLQRVS